MANFFPLLREIVNTYNIFESTSSKHVRSLGVTSSQFDVIATLGNQKPMTCSKLAHSTLMVKGTLTVVLESLLKKKLITRTANPDDARSSLIGLTEAGDKLFHKIFPAHVAYLEQIFNKLTEEEMLNLKNSLATLRVAFENKI